MKRLSLTILLCLLIATNFTNAIRLRKVNNDFLGQAQKTLIKQDENVNTCLNTVDDDICKDVDCPQTFQIIDKQEERRYWCLDWFDARDEILGMLNAYKEDLSSRKYATAPDAAAEGDKTADDKTGDNTADTAGDTAADTAADDPHGDAVKASGAVSVTEAATATDAGDETPSTTDAGGQTVSTTDAGDQTASTTNAGNQTASTTNAGNQTASTTDSGDQTASTTNAGNQTASTTDSGDQTASTTDAGDQTANTTDAGDKTPSSTDAGNSTTNFIETSASTPLLLIQEKLAQKLPPVIRKQVTDLVNFITTSTNPVEERLAKCQEIKEQFMGPASKSYAGCILNTKRVVTNCLNYQVTACDPYKNGTNSMIEVQSCQDPHINYTSIRMDSIPLPPTISSFENAFDESGGDSTTGYCSTQLETLTETCNVNNCHEGYDSFVGYMYEVVFDTPEALFFKFKMPINWDFFAFAIFNDDMQRHPFDGLSSGDMNFEIELQQGQHTLDIYGGSSSDKPYDWLVSTSRVDNAEENYLPFSKYTLSKLCKPVLFPDSEECKADKVKLFSTSPVHVKGLIAFEETYIWKVDVHKGQNVTAHTRGENDVDLYFKWQDCPSIINYDVQGINYTSWEKESFLNAPSDGSLYIGVRSTLNSFTNFELNVTCDGQKKLCKDLWVDTGDRYKGDGGLGNPGAGFGSSQTDEGTGGLGGMWGDHDSGDQATKNLLKKTEPQYKFVGCWQDNLEERDFNEGPGVASGDITTYNEQQCFNACKGYNYFTLQNNGESCYCGQDFAEDDSKYPAIEDSICRSKKDMVGSDNVLVNAVYVRFLNDEEIQGQISE